MTRVIVTVQDRGCSEAVWLWIGSGLVSLGVLSLMEPRILWGLAAVLAYLLVAVPVALAVGSLMRTQR